MIEIGRLCIKIAGRDAKKEAVVIDILDDKFVLIDGNVRRRKCNILHLEPTEKVVKIKKNASTDEVLSLLKEEGIKVTKKASSSKKRKEDKKEGKKSKNKKQTEAKEQI